MQERTRLENAINGVKEIETSVNDNVELIELGEEEGDSEIVKEAEAALKTLKVEADKKQLQSLLSGEVDSNDAFLEINAGAGGTESCDWASMLYRMYTRYAERHGYKVDELDYHSGDEAGVKSATIEIKGENADLPGVATDVKLLKDLFSNYYGYKHVTATLGYFIFVFECF